MPVDHRIDPIVLRALEKEPAERYQQARDVTTDIESLTPALTDAPPTVAEERRPDDWATVKARAATALPVWKRLYARLIGNDLPGSAWPARSSSRWVQWPILTVIGWLYVVSFFLPAVVVHGTITHPLPGGPLEPMTLRGVSCFDWGWTLLRPSWFANPVLWVACVLLAFRFWLWAGFLAQIALLLALTELLHDQLTDYLVGFWLWVGSMGLLAVGAFCGWWAFRRPVFRRPKRTPAARGSLTTATDRPERVSCLRGLVRLLF